MIEQYFHVNNKEIKIVLFKQVCGREKKKYGVKFLSIMAKVQ